MMYFLGRQQREEKMTAQIIRLPSKALVELRCLKINITTDSSLKKKEIRGHHWDDVFVNAGAFILPEIKKRILKGILSILLKHPCGRIIFTDEFEYCELTLDSMLAVDIIRIRNCLLSDRCDELTLNAHCIPLPQVINLNDWLRARRTRGSRK